MHVKILFIKHNHVTIHCIFTSYNLKFYAVYILLVYFFFVNGEQLYGKFIQQLKVKSGKSLNTIDTKSGLSAGVYPGSKFSTYFSVLGIMCEGQKYLWCTILPHNSHSRSCWGLRKHF